MTALLGGEQDRRGAGAEIAPPAFLQKRLDITPPAFFV
jgi:hypothetical protein